MERAIWDVIRPTDFSQVLVESGWVQVITPGSPLAFMNGVYRCELSEAEAEVRVPATIEGYRNRGQLFRWKTCDSSRPADLERLLLHHGLESKQTSFGLIADPKELEIEASPEVEVRELTRALKPDWLTVQAEAWGVRPEGVEFIDRTFEKEFAFIERGEVRAYIAYVEGKPVASASLLFLPGYGYLAGGATAPAYRGRGVYRSLVKARLETLRERGLPAVIHAVSTTSAPICLRLGFRKVCELRSYEPPSL